MRSQIARAIMIGTRTLVIGELVARKKSVKKQKQYSGKAHLVDFESLALGALADAPVAGLVAAGAAASYTHRLSSSFGCAFAG
jgi:hypothetical protein